MMVAPRIVVNPRMVGGKGDEKYLETKATEMKRPVR
jgi:hypothetical protein